MSDIEVLHMVAYLQSQLRLSPNKDAIIMNRDMIKVVRSALEANLKIVQALKEANQAMCSHPNKSSYSDPRDSGWDCPDCGASR